MNLTVQKIIFELGIEPLVSLAVGNNDEKYVCVALSNDRFMCLLATDQDIAEVQSNILDLRTLALKQAHKYVAHFPCTGSIGEAAALENYSDVTGYREWREIDLPSESLYVGGKK